MEEVGSIHNPQGKYRLLIDNLEEEKDQSEDANIDKYQYKFFNALKNFQKGNYQKAKLKFQNLIVALLKNKKGMLIIQIQNS